MPGRHRFMLRLEIALGAFSGCTPLHSASLGASNLLPAQAPAPAAADMGRRRRGRSALPVPGPGGPAENHRLRGRHRRGHRPDPGPPDPSLSRTSGTALFRDSKGATTMSSSPVWRSRPTGRRSSVSAAPTTSPSSSSPSAGASNAIRSLDDCAGRKVGTLARKPRAADSGGQERHRIAELRRADQRLRGPSQRPARRRVDGPHHRTLQRRANPGTQDGGPARRAAGVRHRRPQGRYGSSSRR